MSAVRVCLVSLLSLCLCCVHSARVHTSLGELEGSDYVTNSGKQIFTFFSVPYAKPPVGDSRFKEPKPLKGWFGVWSAKDESPNCVQYIPDFGHPEHVEGSEDCLYLNIYTPTISENSNLPVLVYFHGGAFMFGEGKLYKPTFFLENHDIVYVSVNYRLGPFGFLSTQDNVVPGNNGLKDQVLALKWVQENIVYFGGDKNKVTISGNSAGGASVHFHYLSPLSRGLFDKGISSSGSALMPWALADEPLLKATVLAGSLGCPTDSTEIMVKCLRQRPSDQISLKVKEIFQPWMLNPFSPFGAVVENTSRQAFLSKHPHQLLVEGDVFDRPWLASIAKEEGLYPVAHFIHREDHLKHLNDNWHSIAPHLLDYNYTVTSDKRDLVSDKIRTFYFGNKDISVETRSKVTEMTGDRLFNAEMNHALRLHASSTTSPVFFFTFAYRGVISLSDSMTKTTDNFGVSHFDDIYYLLEPLNSVGLLKSEADRAMITALTNVWAGFIKTGQPSVAAGTRWEPVPQDSETTGQLTSLLITSHDSMVPTVLNDFGNYDFWHSLGLNENINYNHFVKDEL